jgi:hypothetical protein
MENMKSQLSIGFIVDGEISSKYVHELAEWGQKQSDLAVCYLIIQKNINSNKNVGTLGKVIKLIKGNRVHSFLSHLSFTLISKMEFLLLKKIEIHKHYFEKFDLAAIVPKSVIIEPIISKSGFVHRYSDEDIDKVKALGLDLLVRFGSGILRGEILNASKLGIISFHHGDSKKNRGGPPGFWEVFHKKDSTGFMIQSLTEELDGGDVLISGEFQTKSYYLLNRAFLYEKSFVYMKFLLSDIAKLGKLPAARESAPYFNRLFKVPTLIEQFLYVIKFAYLKISESLSYRLFKKSYRWGVAFSRSDWKNLVMWRAIKIVNPVNHFLADPFVISEDGRDYCFVEDYDYGKSRGCISVYELKEKTAECLGDAIVEPFHMSFPYLFRFEGKLYMCPETSEMRDIRLYECINFPLQWKLSKVLMKDVSATDTMIFEKNGIWWLFTNIDPSNIGDHCSELFIFSADNPLSKEWIPHDKNPIIIDSNKARNAGLLFHDDSIYRASQRQGFNLYGKGLSINEICSLSGSEYSESKLCSIEPNFFPDIKGTHHLHSNGSVTAFDFVTVTRYQ